MMKKIVIVAIKILLAVGLLSFLIIRATKGSALSDMRLSELDVPLLALGFFLNFLATLITIVRWRALVSALGAVVPLLDSLRIGFIGFMFNLSPVGIVGGDAIKIVLLNKKNGVDLDKATASAVVDRVIGLFAMFILGAVAIFSTGFNERTETVAKIATQGLIILTCVSIAFFAYILAPTSSKNRRAALANKIPLVGALVAKLSNALILYRSQKKTLFFSLLATFVVHALFSASLFCIARALFHLAPAFVDHLILYCAGNVGSIIPLSAGPLEYFLDELYPLFSIADGSHFVIGRGMAIGVAYRLTTIAVATVGLFFYLFSPADVKQTLKEAKTAERKAQ